MGKAVKNTVLGGFNAGIMAIVMNYVIEKRKFSLLMCINGTLTGIESMCAPCNAVEDWAAVVIGGRRWTDFHGEQFSFVQVWSG